MTTLQPTRYGCARARPPARPQRVEVLRRAAAGGRAHDGALVARRGGPRATARAVRDRDGRPRRRGRERRRAGRPAGPRGRSVRAAAGARPAAPGTRCQPRRPDRGLALRPPHGGVHTPAGPRAPRGPGADRRSDGGARLRSGSERSAALHLDGLHRRGARRPDRRGCVRRAALRLRLVGSARAGRGLAGDALAAARERRVARPRHRYGAERAAGGRLRLPARGRPAGQQGAAPVRAREVDPGALRGQPYPAARVAVRRHAAPRAPGAAERADRERRERRGVLVAGRCRSGRRPRPRGGRRLCPGCGGHGAGRLRRAQLGDRRVCGARRGRAAPPGGDGAEGRAAVGPASRRRPPGAGGAGAGRGGSGTCPSRTPPAVPRCWSAST